MTQLICDDPGCINNPDNYTKMFDPDSLSLCEKCFVHEVEQMSIDDLMEVHVILTTYIDKAKRVEDILALPFQTEDIIDELMASDSVEEVAEAIKEKWTERFNILLKHRMSVD